jgi:predicted nucleotidyltransferase
MVKVDQDILAGMCEEFSLSFVALFGSQLLGRKGLKGDCDIAVFSEGKISGDEDLELVSRFSQILESDAVDVVILNFAPPLIQYEVATYARLLYERKPSSFNRFRWQAVQRWNDNKKFSNLNLDYVKDYLAEMGIGTQE